MNNDMLEMQKEAINRVRDMQKKARTSVNAAEKELFPVKEDIKSTQDSPHRSKHDFLKLFNFKELTPDNDRALIMLIIFLLSGEETDELLIFALIYLLL